jgi:uncharacterized damage-inducible protein DinB
VARPRPGRAPRGRPGRGSGGAPGPGGVTTEEDWPPVADATAAGWKAAVTRLGDAYRAVAADAGLLDDESLARIVTGRDHSISAMLHGVIEHGAYHGGQIAVLKRAGLTPARE